MQAFGYELPEVWLEVYLERPEGCYRCQVEDYDQARLAWQLWMEDQKDGLVTLHLVDGAELLVRASALSGLVVSTPDIRDRREAFEEALWGDEDEEEWLP